MEQGWYGEEVGRLININDGEDFGGRQQHSIKITRRLLRMVSFQKINLPEGVA